MMDLFPEPPREIKRTLRERLASAWADFKTATKPNDQFREQFEAEVLQRFRAALYRTMKQGYLMGLLEKGEKFSGADADELFEAIEPLDFAYQFAAVHGSVLVNKKVLVTKAFGKWREQHGDAILAAHKERARNHRR